MIYLRLRWDSAFIHRFDKLVTSAGTLEFIVVRLEDGRNLIISIVTHTRTRLHQIILTGAIARQSISFKKAFITSSSSRPARNHLPVPARYLIFSKADPPPPGDRALTHKSRNRSSPVCFITAYHQAHLRFCLVAYASARANVTQCEYARAFAFFHEPTRWSDALQQEALPVHMHRLTASCCLM